MEIEVNQTVGEGEEDEEIEKSQDPEEELENALESYRNADIASIHLEIHNLITQQNQTLSLNSFFNLELEQIEDYIAKLNEIAKRKILIDKKSQNIRKRFSSVMEVLKKKKNFK